MWYIFLGAVLLFVLAYFIAAAFRNIAKMKGHTESRYFWWTFWLPPVGMLLVVALPDRNRMANGEQTFSGVSAATKDIEAELPDL